MSWIWHWHKAKILAVALGLVADFNKVWMNEILVKKRKKRVVYSTPKKCYNMHMHACECDDDKVKKNRYLQPSMQKPTCTTFYWYLNFIFTEVDILIITRMEIFGNISSSIQFDHVPRWHRQYSIKYFNHESALCHTHYVTDPYQNTVYASLINLFSRTEMLKSLFRTLLKRI